MRNNQLRERIEEIWVALKGLKASQIENQLQISKNIVESIIGENEIQKIRNTTLLKLLSYELIIFYDQKNQQNSLPSTRRSNEFSRLSERSTQASISVKQVKSLLISLNSRKLFRSGDIKITLCQFEQIMARVNVIEEQLSKEENRKKAITYADYDQDGNELIIEQLQLLLKKKEGRIKELNDQLQQNFLDKQELQQEIEDLQLKNHQLQQLLKNVEGQHQKLKQEFAKYKVQQKEDLLFGASQFMNLTLPHKQIQPVHHTNNHEQNQLNQSDLSQSTRILSRYCSTSEQKPQNRYSNQRKYSQIEEKTAKKGFIMIRNSDIQEAEEQNLLQSVRVKKKHPQLTFQNSDNSLQRMLLMQAIFIEQTIQHMLA